MANVKCGNVEMENEPNENGIKTLVDFPDNKERERGNRESEKVYK